MSSILKALKKLEDETEPGGHDRFVSDSSDTKQTDQNSMEKKYRYAGLLCACFGILMLIAVGWFALARNPAKQPYSRSETAAPGQTDGKSAIPGSLQTALETKAAQPRKQGSVSATVSVPTDSGAGNIQKNMPKIREMDIKQGKTEGKPDPFALPAEQKPPIPVPEKGGIKPISETVKPAPPVSAPPSPSKAVPETVKPDLSVSLPRSAAQPVSETAKPASPMPLLPAPKHPVKPNPQPLLPPPLNPVKTAAPVSVPQPQPVPERKKMPDLRNPAPEGQAEPAKMQADSGQMKKTPQPEPVKIASGSETAKSPAGTEPVKESSPPDSGDCASVKEKTAGESGFSIQALVWSEDPAGRMAVINGTIVREKGMVSDVSVVRIGSGCIVFQKGSEQWMQKFRLN